MLLFKLEYKAKNSENSGQDKTSKDFKNIITEDFW